MDKLADVIDRASVVEQETTDELIKQIQDKIPQPLETLDEPIECNECGEEIETPRALLGYTKCLHCANLAETRSKTHYNKPLWSK